MASNRKSSLFSNSGNFDENFSLVEDSPGRKFETLNLSKRLARSFSQKFKKKKRKRKSNELGAYLMKERAAEKPASSNCLRLYLKGVGCNRVGSCEEIEVNGMRKLSISEDCLPLKIEKKTSRKMKALEQCRSSNLPKISLPDDVLELILARVPLRTLIVSRLVCKKWSQMVISTQFMQLRSELCHKNPWVFLFGLTRKGVHVGEVFALDVVEERWHTIRNDLLENMFLYSVASIGMDIYIVGGCSDFETHKGVFVFSPLTNSWRKVSPMKVARTEPVLAVFEVSVNCFIFQNQDTRRDQNQLKLKNRNCGISDVYEDPHRFSLRRQLRDAFNESSTSMEARIKQSKLIGKGRSDQPKFSLIVVGGSGSRDEPLASGEIYDPLSNNWIEIARLPEDFGSVSSGAVCNGKFYIYSIISNQLASYDLERGFWVLIQTSHTPSCIRMYYPKLISCRNRLFMCCVCWSERDGQVNNNGEQAVRKLWELDAKIHSWTEVSRHPDAPMDKNAIFVADHERIYGLEMFKVFGQALDFLTSCSISNTETEWSRISRKHAGHEACTYSCMTKSMAVLHL